MSIKFFVKIFVFKKTNSLVSHASSQLFFLIRKERLQNTDLKISDSVTWYTVAYWLNQNEVNTVVPPCNKHGL